ncbi:MAG TPA: alpha/beta hydrolase [Chitinophagales bacterium]|nr:alpha/beta hydrolase [Chitinophagales bacterium]
MKFIKSKAFIVVVSLLAVWAIVNILLYEPDIPVEDLKPKYTTTASKFIEIDGQQVHYRIEGEGEPLVLIHGTGAILQTWDGWVNLLSPYYKVIRMDIPAFGLTGPRADGNYSDSVYVDFINQFVTQLGVDSFHLAGNSLGGLIGWKYAAAHPDKVKKLVLIDPAGFHDVNRKGGSLIFMLARNYPGVTSTFSKIGTKYFVKRTLNEVYYDDTKVDDKRRAMYTDLNRRTGNRRAFLDRAKYIRESSEDDLVPITAPTLVMWGREDVLIDVAMAAHFKKIANSTELIYDKVGHSPQEEIPEESAKDVMVFLKTNP